MKFFFQRKFVIFFYALFLFLFASIHGDITYYASKEAVNPYNKQVLKPYLLPKSHPLYPQLRNLFKNPKMFKSADEFRKEGFHIQFGHKGLMVASHPNIKGYLFKKFPDKRSKETQLENYIRRIEGANTIRKFIEGNHFKHLMVPQKWLYRTPYGYILIVEKMDIYNLNETNNRYFQIDPEILKELCTTLHALGGCDAFTRNQPFTRSGKIAFVDTEHVGHMRNAFHKHILPALRHEMREYAISLWKKLDRETLGKKS
jgi:hypothetical protein